MIKIGDYEKILSDSNIFNQIVYTPLSEALQLLEERRKDPEFMKKIETLLKGNIPSIFRDQKCGIMARQLATPNHENRMFLSIAKDNGLHPVFIEYFEDKFTSNNKYKHSLGQIFVSNHHAKNGLDCVERITIIDFNKYNGKKLKDIKTTWDESLIDFHKKLFTTYGLENFSFFNELDWYQKENETPVDFYVNFFLLVTSFGILFENFLSSKDSTEVHFTKNVILPSLEKAINLTGVKPLIVPLEPLDLESEHFWYYHTPIIKKIIQSSKND